MDIFKVFSKVLVHFRRSIRIIGNGFYELFFGWFRVIRSEIFWSNYRKKSKTHPEYMSQEQYNVWRSNGGGGSPSDYVDVLDVK